MAENAPSPARPVAGRVLRPCSGMVLAFLLLGLLPTAVAAQQAAGENAEAYRIGSGDRLQLFVWKEAELTRELTVRADGFVTVPLIGDVRAAGLTPPEVSVAIERKLAQYVNSPNVTVGVLAAQSAQFFVVGRVSRPGAFPLDKPTRVLQALALAGGFLEFAKRDKVLIVRGEGQVIPVDYEKLEKGEGISSNILLKSGDTIVVP